MLSLSRIYSRSGIKLWDYFAIKRKTFSWSLQIFSCGETQYMVLCVRMSVRCPLSVPRFTKIYSPNLCLGKSIVGNVVVWFVCLMTWSGIPHSFQKILLLWLKTTWLALQTKCQLVCLSMSFILRNFCDQSRHFFFYLEPVFRWGRLDQPGVFKYKFLKK